MRIKNVGKLYGALEAIRNVSLDVSANEFVSILGPSGCGKNTLLMMVAGVVDKSAGKISINDTPVYGPRPDIGGISTAVLLPWCTVIDNVLFPLELLREPRANYTERAINGCQE